MAPLRAHSRHELRHRPCRTKTPTSCASPRQKASPLVDPFGGRPRQTPGSTISLIWARNHACLWGSKRRWQSRSGLHEPWWPLLMCLFPPFRCASGPIHVAGAIQSRRHRPPGISSVVSHHASCTGSRQGPCQEWPVPKKATPGANRPTRTIYTADLPDVHEVVGRGVGRSAPLGRPLDRPLRREREGGQGMCRRCPFAAQRLPQPQ